MNNDKKDLRVLKTEHLIKTTFIELVKTIGYQRITIKDLCEKAMINRNTFYLHYNDKDHLVKTMISDTMIKYDEKLTAILNSAYMNVVLNNRMGFSDSVKEFLLLIYQDIELFRMILLDNDLSGYFKSFEAGYEKLILKKVAPKHKKSQIIFRYILSGIGGVLTDWIVHDTSNVDDTALIIAQLVFENMTYFITENKY